MEKKMKVSILHLQKEMKSIRMKSFANAQIEEI